MRERRTALDSLSPDPDVCVHEPAIPESETSIMLWCDGRSAPTIAIEVVSEGSTEKDYLDNPDRCAACGVGELWVFDPLLLGPRIHGGPWRLQVWSRRRDGSFAQTYAGDGPAFSERLDAWLVVTDDGRRLRVADDEDGRAPWPTPEEAERAWKERERAAKDAALAAKDAALAAKDAALAGREAERVAKDAALAEVERLRAELARLRG